MRASQTVPSHRSRRLGPDEVLPDFPLRVALVDGVVAHEGGEALVEPDVVPPFHRDQVAEPHVSNLMSNDTGHRLLRPDAGILVDVHENLAIGYRAPVLHRTIGKFWDGDLVQLGQLIRYSEVGFVVVEDFLGRLEAELCLDTALGPSVGRVEVRLAVTVMLLYKLPDPKIEEVGAHLRGLLERYNLLVGPNLLGLDGHVGDDLEVGARPDDELEDCLERRMV